MSAINEAFRVLSDPGRRALYDSTLRPTTITHNWVAEPAEPRFVPMTSSTTRWPLMGLLLVSVMAVIFVFSAYANQGSGTQIPQPGSVSLALGTCVQIRTGAQATQVPCTSPHYGVVTERVPRDGRCPRGTEGYYDRASPDLVCVKRS